MTLEMRDGPKETTGKKSYSTEGFLGRKSILKEKIWEYKAPDCDDWVPMLFKA